MKVERIINLPCTSVFNNEINNIGVDITYIDSEVKQSGWYVMISPETKKKKKSDSSEFEGITYLLNKNKDRQKIMKSDVVDSVYIMIHEFMPEIIAGDEEDGD